MYQALLYSHSYIRFAVLILLVVVIITSLAGWLGKKNYTPTDNKLNLFLFISTHIQLLLGLILYVVSPHVKFGETTMKDSITRYWTVEHITIMLIAVVLITMARITSKKLPDAAAKHKRVFIFNLIAFLLILAGIQMSGRGFY
ncbi:MAG: cytochrome b [Cyclobacteriaceae bacterium]